MNNKAITKYFQMINKDKALKTGCNECIFLSKGFCKKFGFKPSVCGLAKKCKGFIQQSKK